MRTRIAGWILDYPQPTLLCIAILTLFLGYWAAQVQTDHTAGNFLSQESETLQELEWAGRLFGKSQTILHIVFEEADPYDPTFLRQLDSFTRTTETRQGVDYVLSLTNAPYVVRTGDRLATTPLYAPDLSPEALRARLQNQPFLRGLLLSKDGTTPAVLVKIDAVFNDTPARADLVERIEKDAQALPGRAAPAGFPYLRTQYARRVATEAPLFTLLALLVSLAFLFAMFRSWRAVLLPTFITTLGIVWTVGLVALFGHRLNIVTALLPALIVIIGMATAIHLTTKFYDAYDGRYDVRAALVHTIRTVGVTTFLACLTTAIGFGVLIFSGSSLLSVFGQFAAVGIMALYGLSVTLIPLAYMKLRPPALQMARLATHDTFARSFDQLAEITRRHALSVIGGAVGVMLLSLLGALRLSDDIYVFSDFYVDDPVRQNLAVYEEHFGGVLPMEVIIESKKPGQFRSISRLRQIDQLQDTLVQRLDPVGQALSAANLVKLVNQAYFGGRAAAYRFPSGYELPFLQRVLAPYLEGDTANALYQNLPVFVDSTFTAARIHLGVEDIGTTRMNALADTVQTLARTHFPPDEYNVTVTGSAITTTRSGEHLVANLLGGLAIALGVISVLMAVLFRSIRLTFISLAPNVVPLLVVGGVMGAAGITLKPSTALIFPLAFGIAVDDTIHFLGKYRLLRSEGLSHGNAVRTTLRETGKAILFTSLVLAAGFLVFTLSSFGGTVTMGALTALTLVLALLANLLLLPALLFRYGSK